MLYVFQDTAYFFQHDQKREKAAVDKVFVKYVNVKKIAVLVVSFCLWPRTILSCHMNQNEGNTLLCA